MGATNFSDVSVGDANVVAVGRGDLTDQLARIKADLDAIKTLCNELKADFNGHVHACDGSQAGAYYSSIPDGSVAGETGAVPVSVDAADVSITTK